MKKNEKLDIVYEDKDIIVINKKTHLLTISTENEKEKTLFHQVLMYLKKKNKNNEQGSGCNADRKSCCIGTCCKCTC